MSENTRISPAQYRYPGWRLSPFMPVTNADLPATQEIVAYTAMREAYGEQRLTRAEQRERMGP